MDLMFSLLKVRLLLLSNEQSRTLRLASNMTKKKQQIVTFKELEPADV